VSYSSSFSFPRNLALIITAKDVETFDASQSGNQEAPYAERKGCSSIIVNYSAATGRIRK